MFHMCTHAVLWNTVCDCAKLVHLCCTLKNYRFPMVFNDSHVAHLARCPRAARACRGSLRRRVVGDLREPCEIFNFTNFYKGSAISIRL